jgi:hypothetical protein
MQKKASFKSRTESKQYLEVFGLKHIGIWNDRVERHYCFIDQVEILD